MNLNYITETTQLFDFCKSVKDRKINSMAVDTEFVRRTTYWPKLCLIQIAVGKDIFLIDPLAPSLDLAPLKDIFFDPHILKIFHAARQDLEVFYMLWGDVPTNITDTQILAMVCGFGDSISYDKLSEALAGKKLDKSQQHTDWSQRPLSSKQLLYAQGDVENLQAIYEKLLIIADFKKEYVREEMGLLTNPDLYKPSPENAWLKIKAYGNYKPEFWGVLKKIAAVREEYAQHHNLSRSRVIKDEALIQMALQPKMTMDDLESLGVKEKGLKQGLLQAIQSAEPIKKEFETKLKKNGGIVDVLGILLKIKAGQHNIAPKLIATRDKLESFAEKPETSPLMQGWKLQVFGEDALKIIQGKMALSFDPKTGHPLFLSL